MKPKSNMQRDFDKKASSRLSLRAQPMEMANGGPIVASRVNMAPPDPTSDVERAVREKYGAGSDTPPVKKPMGLRDAIRHGETHFKQSNGDVDGPGGPKDDKVPIMASDGEYVLSKEMVDAAGGVEALNDFKEKVVSMRDGGYVHRTAHASGFADGGLVERVPRPLSPEGVAFEQARGPIVPGGGTAPPAPPPVAVEKPPTLATRGMRAVGSVVATAPLTGFNDYKIDEPGVDSSAMGTMRAAGNQISNMFSGTALPSDREASQASLRKGAVEATLDAGSGLAKTGDFFAGMAGAQPNLTGKYDSMVRSNLGGVLEKPAVAAPAVPAAVPSVSGRTGSTPSEPTINAAPVAPPPVQPSLRSTDVFVPGTDSRDAYSLRRIESNRTPEQERAAADAADRVAVNARVADARARSEDPRYAQADAGTSLRRDSMPVARPYGDTAPGTFSDAMNSRAERKVASQERELSQRERENQRSTAVSLRGQDITANTALSGQASTAHTAAVLARMDQMNKDRSYQMDVAKYGTEVAKQNQSSREAGAKATHERITGMLPPGPDGKPDTTRAAQYSAGLNALLGEKIAQTQAYLAKNPGDAHATAWLEKAHANGMGALDESDIRRFISGMEAKSISEENHSVFNPFGGTAVSSDAPVGKLTLRKGLITNDYVSDRGDVIPARAIDKRGSFMGLGGLRSTNQEILKGR